MTFLKKLFKDLSRKQKIAIIISSLILSIFITISFLSQIILKIAYQKNLLLVTLVLLFYTIALIINIAGISLIVKRFSVQVRETEINKRRIIFYALPCFAMFMIFFIARFPAIFDFDVYVEWRLIHSNPMQLSNWHPLIHTMFMKGMTLIWDSPASIAIFQDILTALIIGYSLYRAEVFGVKRLWIWIAAGFLTINPIIASYSNTIWKDTLYADFILLLTVLIANIYFTKGSWIKSPLNMVLLIVTLFLSATLRFNGIISAVLSAIFICVLAFIKYRKYFIRYLLSISIFAIILWFYSDPLMHLLNVDQPPFANSMGVPLQIVAGAISDKADISNEEMDFFNQVITNDGWKDYNPYVSDYIKSNQYMDYKLLEKEKFTFLKYTFDVAIKNPKSAITSYMKLNSYLWSVPELDEASQFQEAARSTVNLRLNEDYYTKTFGYFFREDNGLLNSLVIKVTQLSLELPFNLVFGNAAFYLYLILIFLVALCIRDGKTCFKSWFITLPVLANMLGLLIVNVAQQVRYAYSEMLCLPILLLFLLLANQKHSDNDTKTVSITQK